jgi:hypothetical protein
MGQMFYGGNYCYQCFYSGVLIFGAKIGLSGQKIGRHAK